MFVEVHVLQQLAPSNINSDQQRKPKTAWFGKHLRHIVSSASWKHAIRDHFRTTLDPTPLTTQEELRAWIERQAQQAGLALIQVHMTPRWLSGWNTRLRVVTYDGLALVNDTSALLEAVAKGIGPSKAFGCGLLSLAPIQLTRE